MSSADAVRLQVEPEKRICVMHLIHTMAYGGVETVVINWLRKIDRDRFDIHLVCFDNPDDSEEPFVEAARNAGLTVSKIPWGRRKPLLKAARALAAMVREHGVDILHAHNWYADFIVALTARLVPVKTITTLYVWHDYDWKRNILQAIDQRVIRAFDRITAHCDDTRRKTIERGIAPQDVDTLICGFETHRVELDSEERAHRRREQGVGDDDIVLLNIARLYPEKAHDGLLRSFKLIHERCPRAQLWIAGVGPLEDEVKALCTELGLDDSVRFLGFVKDLPSLLALADIQVHPAHIEGVPLAVCEGMAAGLPIVVSEVGGLPEVVDYGRTGILVKAGDETGFAEAVLNLIEHPEKGREIGAAARQFMENDYSLATAVHRVEDTYRDMMGLCE